jgi:hypothetical protein
VGHFWTRGKPFEPERVSHLIAGAFAPSGLLIVFKMTLSAKRRRKRGCGP